MSDAVNIHDYQGDTGSHVGPDLTSLGPTHQCICGNSVFKIFASFEGFELASYSTTGECIECHARVTVPTPIDNPEYLDDCEG